MIESSMESGPYSIENKADRRAEAEKIASSKKFYEDESVRKDMRNIVHELHVHKIELEMQNEELRRAEEELALSRARYFDLYDLAPVGYLTADSRMTILESNLTAARMLGIERGKLRSTKLSSWILTPDHGRFFKARTKLLETGEPQSEEFRVLRPDGRDFWAHIVMSIEIDKSTGEPGFRIVMSDVQKMKDAESTAKTAEAKNELLLHELQHRIKNTFNSICSLISLEVSDAPEPAVKESLDALKSRISTLSDLYSTLYSTGHSHVVRLDSYLAKVMRSILEGTVPTSGKISFEVYGDDVVVSESAASSYGLILNELLTNSIKYSFKGGRSGRCVLSIRQRSDNIFVTLSSEGDPLPEDFDIQNPKGRGLKLCNSLAQVLGGGIEVDRDPFTKFTLTTPLEKSM